MGKANSKPPKKQLSEGKTIALAVLLITGGIIAVIYLLIELLSYFFPGFIN